MRVVRRTIRLREREVEVSADHGGVEIVLRESPQVDVDSDFGEVSPDVIFDGEDRSITFKNDEIDVQILAVVVPSLEDPVSLAQHRG